VNIGQAAKVTGISAKTIRHYEAIGLMPRAARSESGYRRYQPSDLHLLKFVRQARAVGFSIADVKRLLALWQDRRRPAREVKRLAERQLTDIEARIGELEAIAGTLAHLVAHCRGDDRPECPILDAIAGADHAPHSTVAGNAPAARKRAPKVRRLQRT
jgi:MerR family transcriptional regulator, copper efflux regulator